MDLQAYRNSENEQLRISNLMALIPSGLQTALDAGAREGYLSKKLTNYVNKVVAVDLQKPEINDANIECRQGDISALEFSDNSFDLVLCAEVLEHIPKPLLEKACHELARVSQQYLLIGVPYDQDIRVGRTTCFSCGGKNPPWGHVNNFNEKSLEALFPTMKIQKYAYVGQSTAKTNSLSAFLFDLANNPYGTYDQDETCIHCDKKLLSPPPRTLPQKIFTKIAVYLNKTQALCIKSKPNWIHALLIKAEA